MTTPPAKTIPGLSVLTFMAAVWCVLALVSLGSPRISLAAPVVLSLAIYVVARQLARNLVPRTPAEEARIGKLVAFWSLAEGVVFTPVAVILANTGLARLIPAALAIVVGLHFLPLARGTPRPLNYVTGAVMTGAGLVGLLGVSGGVVALVCAATLWATCLAMIAQAARLPARAT